MDKPSPPAAAEPSHLRVSFNADASCVSLAGDGGVSVYATESGEALYSERLGPHASHCEQLLSTALLAVAGRGSDALAPRRLSVLSSAERSVIADLDFAEAVTAIRLSPARLLVLSVGAAHVYALATLQALETLPTPPNARGVCALSASSADPLLALPTSDARGGVVVRAAGGRRLLAELAAHTAPLACLAFCAPAPDGGDPGQRLATASLRGTVVKIFDGAQRWAQSHSLRRGWAAGADVHSLALSPGLLASAGCEPEGEGRDSSILLLHVWRLEERAASPQPGPSAAAAAAQRALAAAASGVGALRFLLPLALRASCADTLAQRASLTLAVPPPLPPPTPPPPPPARAPAFRCALALAEQRDGAARVMVAASPPPAADCAAMLYSLELSGLEAGGEARGRLARAQGLRAAEEASAASTLWLSASAMEGTVFSGGGEAPRPAAGASVTASLSASLSVSIFGEHPGRP